MRNINDFAPAATAALIWRCARDTTTTGIESLNIGPQTDLVEQRALDLLDACFANAAATGNAGTPGPVVSYRIDVSGTVSDGPAFLHCTALPLGGGGDACLVICRPEDEVAQNTISANSPTVVDALLLPHHINLSRAMRAMLDYRGAIAARDQALTLAGASTDATLLVDSDGGLRNATAQARALLEAGDIVRVGRDGRLTFADSGHAAALRRALLALADDPASGPAALRLTDADAASNLWLVVSVMRTPPSPVSLGPTFALTFKSVNAGLPVPAPVLMRAFDLTKTEAQIVAALVAGQTIKDYAEAVSRKETTVRWHFGNASEKMGCHSQTDVVRLVLRLLAS
jgi:DNA-binding CsgD family transcriptional regulator